MSALDNALCAMELLAWLRCLLMCIGTQENSCEKLYLTAQMRITYVRKFRLNKASKMLIRYGRLKYREGQRRGRVKERKKGEDLELPVK